MYLILMTHGEWDDYVEIPLFCVEDYDEAHLITDALEKEEQPYYKYVQRVYGNDVHVSNYELSFEVMKIDVVKI